MSSLKDFDNSVQAFYEGDNVIFHREHLWAAVVVRFFKNEVPPGVDKDSVFTIAEVLNEPDGYSSKPDFSYKISFNGQILGPEDDNLWSAAYFQKHEQANIVLKIGDICPKCKKEYKERYLATSSYIGCWC